MKIGDMVTISIKGRCTEKSDNNIIIKTKDNREINFDLNSPCYKVIRVQEKPLVTVGDIYTLYGNEYTIGLITENHIVMTDSSGDPCTFKKDYFYDNFFLKVPEVKVGQTWRHVSDITILYTVINVDNNKVRLQWKRMDGSIATDIGFENTIDNFLQYHHPVS